MKKNNLILLFVTLGFIGLNAQTNIWEIEPKWDYDKIEYIYDTDLLMVEDAKKIGIMNINGEFVLPIEYEIIDDLNDDVIFLKKDERCHVFNFITQKMLPIFGEKIIGKSRGNLIWLENNKKWQVYNDEGELQNQKKYDFVHQYGANSIVQADGKYGYVDSFGIEVIPTIYDDVSITYESLGSVKKNGKWAIINCITGSFVTDFISSGKLLYENAMIDVSDDLLSTVYDIEGNVIIDKSEFEIEVLYSYCNFIVMRNRETYKISIADKKGNLISELNEYEEVNTMNYNHWLPVKKDGKWGAINDANEVIFPFEYYKIEIEDGGISKSNTNLWVKLNDKIGYYARDKTELIPPIYDDVEYFFASFDSTNYELVKKGEKWGIIDIKGNAITDFDLEEEVFISFETNNISIVKKDGYFRLINEKGEIVSDLKLEEVEGFFNKKGLMAAKYKGKWGIIKNPYFKKK